MPPKTMSAVELQTSMSKFGNPSINALRDYYSDHLLNAEKITEVFFGNSTECKEAFNFLNNQKNMWTRQRGKMCAWAMELHLNPKLTLDDLLDISTQEARDRKRAAANAMLNLYRSNELEFNSIFAKQSGKITDMVFAAVRNTNNSDIPTAERFFKYQLIIDGLFDAVNQRFINKGNHNGVSEETIKQLANYVQNLNFPRSVMRNVRSACDAAQHDMSIHTADALFSRLIAIKAWPKHDFDRLVQGQMIDSNDMNAMILRFAEDGEAASPKVFARGENPTGILACLDDEELMGLAFNHSPEYVFNVTSTPTGDMEKPNTYTYTINGIDLKLSTPVSEIPKKDIDAVKKLAQKALKEVRNQTLSVNFDDDLSSDDSVEIISNGKSIGTYHNDSNNYAMYLMALKLGHSNMFATSYERTVQVGEDKQVNGFFTDVPQGYNVTEDRSKFNQMLDPETSPINCPKGILAMADLQVFSYLTTGKMSVPLQDMYFQSTIEGVTSIAIGDSKNTGAFPAEASDQDINFLVLSDQTSNCIKKLDNTEILDMLQSAGIKPEAANQVINRLNRLKEMLNNPSKTIEPGKICVLNSVDEGKFKLKDILNAHERTNQERAAQGLAPAESLFAQLSDVKTMRNAHPERHAGKFVKANDRAFLAGNLIDSMDDFLKEYKDGKLIFRGSDEYDMLGKALNETLSCAHALRNKNSTTNLDELKAKMQFLKEASNNYIQRHIDEGPLDSLGSNTRKRMNIALKIQEFSTKQAGTLQGMLTRIHESATVPFYDKIESMRAATDNIQDPVGKQFGYNAVAGMGNLVSLMQGKASDNRELSNVELELAKKSMADVTAFAIMSRLRMQNGGNPSAFENAPEGGDVARLRANQILESAEFRQAIGNNFNASTITHFLEHSDYDTIATNTIKNSMVRNQPANNAQPHRERQNERHEERQLG